MGTADEIVNLDDDSAKVDLELGRIRERRENPGKSFLVNSIIPRTFDDYTLVVGLISGLVFFGSIFVASSGLIWGNSIAVDETLSGTFLDPSDCDDKRDEIWFETWVNQDQDLRIRSHNADSSSTALFITLWNQTEGYALSLESESAIGGIGDLSETVENHGLEEGDYLLLIQFRLWTDSSMDLSNQSFEELSSRVQDDPPDFESSKNFDITVETVKSASLLGSGEYHKKMETFDDEPRACFTVQRMGGWGWALMFAEWVGGRETAMLTGGSAQVPPWYMAMVSLGMSIFFLCVQYPLMHRLYHRDVDDLLSSKQMSRLIETTIESASEKLHIEPEYSLLKIQDRAISVDVILHYKTTMRTIVTPIDVKSSIIKAILNEFRIFGEMRPLQIKTVCTDSIDVEESTGEWWGEGNISFHLPDDYSEDLSLAEDYSQFFVRMGRFGKLEEVFRESMSRWFKKHGVIDYGSAIMADEEAVFVRVIYRPQTKFAYFLFKPTYQHLQGDLREQMQSDLKILLEDRVLVVSARNEKSTMADRAVAGRVEQGSQELTGEAMVAKRGGIPGALLQNPFMGDILSSVEYVAHKNRARIDRYGFWGLIAFVWIPFMASGVLVGAMLGLVARMRFQRVLAACFIGGTAASVTWAYTARGIIEAMERYHAEALIPFVILLAIVFTWLKIRDNKRHRREELFRDSMSFFAGAPES
ncbi:MAG TPA: small multi-drug export protein [Candidatus Thalassarchaeaceae archaeon]|nr:small multi-drug export protein [Candidatus Thalassarchaeaceae archaeon]